MQGQSDNTWSCNYWNWISQKAQGIFFQRNLVLFCFHLLEFTNALFFEVSILVILFTTINGCISQTTCLENSSRSRLNLWLVQHFEFDKAKHCISSVNFFYPMSWSSVNCLLNDMVVLILVSLSYGPIKTPFGISHISGWWPLVPIIVPFSVLWFFHFLDLQNL